MRKRDVGLLGASRDRDALLESIGFAYEYLDDAVEAGALFRVKITNKWLYASSTVAFGEALDVVEADATRRVRPWLLGQATWIRGPIAQASTSPRLTSDAVELLLRQLARARRLRAMGLVTGGYEPYLGLYGPDDEDEVGRQVEALVALLRKRGYAGPSDLPAPMRRREKDGWRWMILHHGEFLGLGRLDGGVLRTWEADAA
jgi:hypothetical protein